MTTSLAAWKSIVIDFRSSSPMSGNLSNMSVKTQVELARRSCCNALDFSHAQPSVNATSRPTMSRAHERTMRHAISADPKPLKWVDIMAPG